MTIKKNFFTFFLVSALILAAAFWTYYSEFAKPAAPSGAKVIATIYPLAYLANKIGGERISLETIVPAGVEAHDFEPTAQDLARLSDSQLVLAAGSGLDSWLDKLRPDIQQAGGEVIVAGELLSDLSIPGDPHVWLDPRQMMVLAQQITRSLTSLDPDGQEVYQANLNVLLSELSALDGAYRQGLSNCVRREFVTAHAAFAYLAAAYDLEQIAITGLDPAVEPGAGQLAELADQVRQRDIKYIFFEEMAGPEMSKTLATEVGAAVLVLNSIESLPTEMQSAGQDYVSEMLNNLNNLQIALECQP